MLLAVNLVLMRRAVRRSQRLTALMRRVDPLEPGRRIESRAPGPRSAVLTETFNEMLDRLEARASRQRAPRALAAQQEERRRIARELHDEIGQDLTALALQPRPGHRGARRDDLRDEVVDARDGVLATVEDVRGVVRTLRPEGLDDAGAAGRADEPHHAAHARTGIQIVRELQRDLPELDDDQKLVLFRVAQESVTNAIRHADASCIGVVLRADGEQVG